MRKLLNVITITLALNFLAVLGALGWLVASGKLTRESVAAMRQALDTNTPAETSAAPTTQPTTQPAADSMAQLEELLRQHAGRPMTEQVQFLQQRFDAQATALDRRARELNDLQRQVDLAQQKLAADRRRFESELATFNEERRQATAVVQDKAFDDSLALYSKMSAKQVKQVFAGLDDVTVTRYLRSMDPRVAAKIIKEFKTPDEIARIQRIMESLRKSGVDAGPFAEATPR
jgi:flagellar motility protein MotE (MotC chaperone)